MCAGSTSGATGWWVCWLKAERKGEWAEGRPACAKNDGAGACEACICARKNGSVVAKCDVFGEGSSVWAISSVLETCGMLGRRESIPGYVAGDDDRGG